MKSKIAVVAIAAVMGAVVFFSLRRTNPSADAPSGTVQATPIGVTIATAQLSSLPVTFSAAGRAEAKASVLVKARVEGQIAEVAFQEGRPVHKGQLLFRLDSAVLDAQARQAEGVLARDHAQLAKLRSDEQRNQALADQGFISPSGLAQTRSDLEGAQATLSADRAALDTARLQVSYSRITAPMDGVAGAAQIPVGGAAKAGDTTLVVINQVQPIYISFAVPEPQLAVLREAMHRGPVPVKAMASVGSPGVAGTLAFIDNAVDASNGSIVAKALFDNRDTALTPGQYAQVTVQVGLLSSSLVVPSTAVESGTDGPYVFIVQADSTVAIRAVTIGIESAGMTAISHGLAAGDVVVTSGHSRLRDKARVRTMTSADKTAP
ncbi:MAG: efflux RND transporter periplasmic adaptor subunit [Rhizobacter sp.]